MFSLVDRELFQNTVYLYYSMTREGLGIKWVIRNLDFFPFLRFYQSLTKGSFPVQIGPSRLHIDFDENNTIDDELHARNSHVEKLIELHWLDGFPLWGCLTGLSDRPDCKGPLGDYMYSVRQIVALYWIDLAIWRTLSTEYLSRCRLLVKDESPGDMYTAMSDTELVETVINLICAAIRYDLGYEGNYARVGRDGSEWDEDVFEVFRYKGRYRETAYAMEHAWVHTVGQYRKKIDEELRDRLGEAYEEWKNFLMRREFRTA
jgi:hypothetical protein